MNQHRLDVADAIGRPITRAERIFPIAGLFLGAPLVAEFLLGNMSITHLGMLVILAPLYGGGALLIRECVRRTGRGWPSIFLLALAYGILEEAFLMQSLFNPNFLGKQLHLLEPAYLSAFGIGGWYTVFVLTLHTVWSIAVPIVLVETLIPQRANSSWLGRVGLAVFALAFALASVAIASWTRHMDPAHFVASGAQFAWSAAIILALIGAALGPRRRRALETVGSPPEPWTLAIGSFAAASAFLLIPRIWGWWAFVAYVALDASAIWLIWKWSGRAGWHALHKLALGGGAAMAYAIHAFTQSPSLGTTDPVTRVGNLFFALLTAGLLAAGARRLGAQTSRPSRQV